MRPRSTGWEEHKLYALAMAESAGGDAGAGDDNEAPHGAHDGGGLPGQLLHRCDPDDRGALIESLRKRRDLFRRSGAHSTVAHRPTRLEAHDERSEERRVGKEGRSRWSPYH